MPASQFLNASVSMSENNMLNSVVASTQPSLTPLGMGKESVGSACLQRQAKETGSHVLVELADDG